MIPSAGTHITWCECCNNNEALIRVTEEFGDKSTYIHQWCIECTKAKVASDGEHNCSDLIVTT